MIKPVNTTQQLGMTLPRRLTDRAPWHENSWDCHCGERNISYPLHPNICPRCGCDARRGASCGNDTAGLSR